MTMRALVTLAEEKPFEYKIVDGGEIIVYPSDANGRPQRKDALAITPQVITMVRAKIQESGRIVIGASRDNPPAGSLGAYLKQFSIPPSMLSYLSAILVTQGFCEYLKFGKRVVLLARAEAAAQHGE
jgi:hypothetical protein